MNYDSTRRRGAAHEPTPRTGTFYFRHRRKRHHTRPLTEPTDVVPTVAEVADTDNLIATFYAMKASAGQAPGPDGITYADLGRREVADVLRELSAAVLAGDYKPGPTRKVRIAKPRGGHRTLALGDVCDRVLAAALNEALTPRQTSVEKRRPNSWASSSAGRMAG